MHHSIRISLFSLCLLAATAPVIAQEYPYDDYVPELKKKKDYDTKYKIPVERPQKDSRPTEDVVFGVNLQGGVSYGLFQEPQTNTTSLKTLGPGYAVALGFSWDMQNHPISIELEPGFQQILMGTSNQTSVIPVKFSTYYLNKLSPDAVMRVGLGSSLDLRIVDGQVALHPGWHLSLMYEYASFTFEPTLQIMRLASGNSFVLGTFYLGYRI